VTAGRRAHNQFSALRVLKLVLLTVFLYATCGPAVFAVGGNSATFWIEQRQLSEETQKSIEQRPAPAPAPRKTVREPRDFVPTEATRVGAENGPVTPNFFIYVIGDSMAILAADGLRAAFADNPKIVVNGRARDSSGLVRDDFYDWVKAAKDLAAEKTDKNHIDYVVMHIGINDIQSIKDGADSLDPLTDRWREIYGKRVEAIVEPFRHAHIPVLWLGLPPMHNDKFSDQISKLNEIVKEHAEKAGAKYIDIWNAFTDENGAYSAFGPDVNGQTVRLRIADGVYYTKAGARKAAQFVESDIRRAFESVDKPPDQMVDLPPDLEHAATDINAEIRREMGLAPPPAGETAPIDTNKPLAGPVLPLTTRPLSPGGALATRPAWSSGTVAALNVLATGVEPPAKPGRADDFAWPTRQ
jgi:uncharacterized protein